SRISADTRLATPGGASFTAPAGWSVRSTDAMVVLQTPEPDSHVDVIDVQATDADAAVAAAWKLYKADAKRPLKLATDRPARNGWDARRVYDYETSPNERAVVQAVAYRAGAAWTVLIVDGTEPTFERRAAPLSLVAQSLRPKGYQRESFAGRTSHPLDAERIANIKSLLESGMKELGVPGVAFSLIDRGKVVFEGGLGVRELGKIEPTSKFGEVFQYSNLMAAAAGFVGGSLLYPGRELGAAYDDAMRTQIFEPLGMSRTTFDFARAQKSNHARPHGLDVDGKLAIGKMDLNYAVVPVRPAGGMWTSV